MSLEVEPTEDPLTSSQYIINSNLEDVTAYHWSSVEKKKEAVLFSDLMRDTHLEEKFGLKDSGKREEFDSGMVRDTSDNKVDYERVFHGPMLDRWASHMTKGAIKYEDSPDGTPNWTKARGDAELRRFRKSAVRHFRQWLRGDTDEDHASAVFFNINGVEYVKERKDPCNPQLELNLQGPSDAGKPSAS
jgi:hypothetical protein